MDKGTLSTLSWLTWEWKDPFLMWWNFTKFDEYKKVPLMLKRSIFLAPTGAQEMLIFICPFVWFKLVQSSQSSSSQVRDQSEHSESIQRSIREKSVIRAFKSESYSRSLKYCVLLSKELFCFKIQDIRLPVSNIWTPDLEIYNGISQDLTTRTDTAVITNCQYFLLIHLFERRVHFL